MERLFLRQKLHYYSTEYLMHDLVILYVCGWSVSETRILNKNIAIIIAILVYYSQESGFLFKWTQKEPKLIF